MRVDVCRPEELDADDIDVWRKLAAADSWLAHPFLGPDFAAAVAPVRQDARVAVVSDGGAVRGFVPYERDRMGVGRPLARFMNIAQGIVHEAGYECDERELLRGSRLSLLSFDSWLPAATALTPSHIEWVDMPVIDLSSGFETYHAERAAAHRKTFKTIAYRRRKLERELGTVEFTFDDPDPAVVRELLHWKSLQYRRSGWPDVMSRPWVRELVDRVAALRAPGTRGVVSTLRVDGRLIAADLSLLSDSVYAGWIQAHDTSLNSYSPGMIRTMGIIEAAAGAGARFIALGRSDEDYKQILKNADSVVGEGFAALPTFVAGLYRLRQAPGRSLRRSVLRHERLRSAVRGTLRRAGDLRLRLSGR
jgi:CelD/BcsL family acetyltransferase involved in cellulose biosynthesis